MEIKWRNLIALILLVLCLILGLKFWTHIRESLSTMTQIGSGHTPQDQLIGMMVLGVILVTIVAIVRIICSSNQSNR